MFSNGSKTTMHKRDSHNFEFSWDPIHLEINASSLTFKYSAINSAQIVIFR